jgi:ABC-type transport system substrate-binding protein
MENDSRKSVNPIALTRRDILAGGAAMLVQLPALGSTPAGASPNGAMTLAWHTAMAPRWLDPQEHDGTATPDNFLTALHDALIKNSGTALYDHPSLAERYEFAKDGKSATFWLREGIKFHNGEPVTPEDVKFSYESYRGALASAFKAKTEAVEIVDKRTVRFRFKEPFLDFLLLLGSGNVTIVGPPIFLEAIMTTNERPRTRPLQHGFALTIGYLAMAVSVAVAVRFAYASADTTKVGRHVSMFRARALVRRGANWSDSRAYW